MIFGECRSNLFEFFDDAPQTLAILASPHEDCIIGGYNDNVVETR